MAESLIANLLKTPQQVREEQMVKLRNQGVAQAQLMAQPTGASSALPSIYANLARQGIAGAGERTANIARLATQGAGSLLGAAGASPELAQAVSGLTVSPEERQAGMLQETLRQVDPNNLNNLRAVRKRLQDQGAPAQAIMYIDAQIAAKEKEIRERSATTRDEARAEQELQAKTNQLNAQAQYYKAQAANEGKPDEVRLMEYYQGLEGDDKEIFLNNFAQPGKNLPKDVQTYLFYKALPSNEQANFLKLKRSNQIVNRGDQIDILNPDGTVAATFNVKPKPGETPEHRAAVVVAEQTAENVNKAELDLPSLQTSTQGALDLISQIKNDPSLPQVIGVGALLNPLAKLPGAPAQKTKGDIDRLAGKVFLQAYASLRGAQGITDIEGEKATQAIANLNKLQNTEDFIASLTELENVLKKELGVVQGIAGKGKKPIRKYNPVTGEFE